MLVASASMLALGCTGQGQTNPSPTQVANGSAANNANILSHVPGTNATFRPGFNGTRPGFNGTRPGFNGSYDGAINGSYNGTRRHGFNGTFNGTYDGTYNGTMRMGTNSTWVNSNWPGNGPTYTP